jgi:hypothetical protein
MNGIYIPRPSDAKSLKANFDKDLNSYMEVFTGLYVGKNAFVKSASVQDGELSFVLDYEGEDKNFSISLDGGQTTIERQQRKSLSTGNTIFDHEIGVSITTDISYDSIFQYSHLLVLKSSFDVGVVIDINAAWGMVYNNTLCVDNTISFVRDDGLYIAKHPDFTAFSIDGHSMTIGSDTVDLLTVLSPAYGLIIDGDMADTITYDQYTAEMDDYDKEEVLYNGFIDIHELDTQDVYIVKAPRETTSYIQVKEQ